MGFFNKLFSGTRKLHKETEAKKFIKRYATNELVLQDHYYHLIQLLPLYEAMETKMKSDNFLFQFPECLKEILLSRSNEIIKDIEYLSNHIGKKANPHQIKATEVYRNHLNKITDPEELLAHFLVRILGDLFGGQKIKNYVKTLYSQQNLKNITQGLNFYNFDATQLNPLSELLAWIERIEIKDEDKFVKHANLAFQNHMDMFDQLEKNRENYQQKWNCQRFFTKRNALILGTLAISSATLFVFSQ